MNNYISTAALYYPNGPYLAHHGIKGQKWGIRKYQNEDGSLTLAGERRYYGEGNRSVSGSARRALAKVYDLNARTYSKRNKTLSSMNSAERDRQLQKAKEADARAGEKRRAREAALLTKQRQAEKIAKNQRKVEYARGEQLSQKKHAVLRAGGRHLVRSLGHGVQAGIVAAGVTALTKNPKLAAAAGGAYYAAAKATNIVRTGRDVFDVVLYKADNREKK